MKNETQKHGAKSLKQELPTRNSRQQEESQTINHAARWWTSLINPAEAWEEPVPPKRKETTIDPREFTGTAPPFSWE